MARSKSSKRWLDEHQRDGFVQRARAEGHRSRAVYKLEQIQRKDRILKAGQLVLDLGAAPGGWSEFARRAVGERGRVIALDLLAIEPIAGVEFVQGDFTDAAVLARLLELAGPRRFDLVLSDMAPNLSGMQSLDQPRAIHLAELALELAREHLAPDGAFLVKLFQGQGFEDLVAQLRRTFSKVRLRKPEASRARSSEIYALCSGLRQTGSPNLR